MIRTKQELEDRKSQQFFRILQSKEELDRWLFIYFGLRFPKDTIDPDSNSNPLDAIWRIYKFIRDNEGEHYPGFILLSGRDCGKTLSSSVAEALIILHFGTTIAHMAAILKQSQKASEYIIKALNKWAPYIEKNGWLRTTENKTKIEFKSPTDSTPYLDIIVATMQGTNSSHTNVLIVDEIDVISNPLILEEAKMIPSMQDGRYPLRVKLSTRKFAFGLMQKELDDVEKTKEVVLRWNILDMAERCDAARHKPALDGSKVDMYVAHDLPLRTITPEAFEKLEDKTKGDFELLQAHPGCATCPLAPVCKGRLADKGEHAKGGLYKPIPAILGLFNTLNPDVAEAQLLCRKPSSKGLIYPRFLNKKDDRSSNTLSIKDAWEIFTGDESLLPDETSDQRAYIMDRLVEELVRHEIPMYAGLDWGYTHDFAIVVGAIMPSGDVWILETFAEPGLELDDQLKVAKAIQAKYNILKWFADPAYPGSIKTFKRNGLKCIDFTKDVMGGIEATRGQIVDATGKRRLKVLLTSENQQLIHGFKVHHFKLNAQGNPTTTPDDEEYADMFDALRYFFQNLFGGKNGKVLVGKDKKKQEVDPNAPAPVTSQLNQELMQQEIKSKLSKVQENSKPNKKKGMAWNI